MYSILIFYLFAALLLYILFAGADFGAGILELFSSSKDAPRHQKITYRAIGPVWEANHIWIILLIVILFNGFPKLYSTISTYLHIPLLLMLVGIILRGTAFVFRHYDAVKDGSQKVYSLLFAGSSFITPLFLGIIAGATILGKIDVNASSFYDGYIAPWFNLFSLSIGLLFCTISGFLAAVFLVGEPENKYDIQHFINHAKIFNIGLVIVGVFVFIMSEFSGVGLIEKYLQHPIAWGSVLLATLALPALWYAMRRSFHWLARFLAGFQVTMIVLAWLVVQYPSAIVLANGQSLGLPDTLAPIAVQKVLVTALIIGSLLIFPALYYLLRVFKREG